MTEKGKQASPFKVLGTCVMPDLLRLESEPAPYGPPPYRVMEVFTSEYMERRRLEAAEKDLRDFEWRYGSARHLKELAPPCAKFAKSFKTGSKYLRRANHNLRGAEKY